MPVDGSVNVDGVEWQCRPGLCLDAAREELAAVAGREPPVRLEELRTLALLARGDTATLHCRWRSLTVTPQICAVTLLPVLSFSVKMTVPPGANFHTLDKISEKDANMAQKLDQFQLFRWLYAHRDVSPRLHLLGQPDTFLGTGLAQTGSKLRLPVGILSQNAGPSRAIQRERERQHN
jgi:hypothetical protein